MLSNFGFGDKWVEWIKECITSARISVLINGSPIGEFSPQRGLRQGDPFSPFLFNIATKGLSLLLSRALELEIIKGVKIGSGSVGLTHLQFADDSILFCEADLVEVRNLKRILRWFEVLSGLKINYHKSVVCGVGVQDELMNEYASVLNCKVFQFRRELYDWERVEVSRLITVLETAPSTKSDAEDALVWVASKSGSFSGSSLYKNLAAGYGNKCPTSKSVWVKYILPRVQFFGWLAWKGRLKTTDFLLRIDVLTDNTSAV
ncbi:uncharacterized protein LOC114292296 [Camellia sinensis]|uniref:uncharacterized protein LOC114292296 n=1 Tax=Camellia sinensis TaxID=4442 RepID=UPI001036865B|nr:uncharacterized protein LOC114292296 [Camellia sinensis]